MMSEKQAVLITGAGSGIGLATARKYLQQGANIAMLSHTKKKMFEGVKDLNDQYSDRIFIYEVDISDSHAVDEAVQAVIDHFGAIDVAVNNAGISGNFKPLADLSDADFSQVIDVDLKGTFYCMRAELKYFAGVKHGSIVNVSAEGSLTASPTMAAYISAKAGMNGLTRAAAIDYVRQGIRVNAVAPGGTYTNMTADTIDNTDFGQYIKRVVPMGRIAKPDEIADAIIYLASDKASFMTGQVVAVDGGQSTGLM